MGDKPIFTPFSAEQLMPQAEKLEVMAKKGALRIGIPRETHLQEKRVCLTPDAVGVLVENGHEVFVETQAGEGAHYDDVLYAEAGAKICYNTKDVFQQNIILKIEPPDAEEIGYLQSNSLVISAVQPVTQNSEFFRAMAKKKVCGIGYEFIQDQHGYKPVVRLIAEIAGTSAILVAAELMSSSHGGNGVLIGGIAGVRPTEVVVLGAGTVGEYASRAAIGLGVSVRVFDSSITKLRRLQNNLPIRVSTSTLDPKELEKSLRRCDLVIGALRGETRAPTVVTDAMVQKMKPGSIIVDVSIDHGGCIETSSVTTHEKPTFVKHDVVHYAVTNITSRYARTSSKALSNFFLPFLLEMGNEGGFEHQIVRDKSFRSGVYTYKGLHTNLEMSTWFDLPFHDINLLMI
ncbi:MAG: alanine dehydrogenase [Weeksellaceae bacterium]|nr:alanine dehydrogenase [Weeksellaceae bacterium]